MRKFPEDPRNCNPIQLINQMKPGVKFIETIISSKTPSVFQVKCEIDSIPFTGQGNISCNNIILLFYLLNLFLIENRFPNTYLCKFLQYDIMIFYIIVLPYKTNINRIISR